MAELVRRLLASTRGVVSIGGPELATRAIASCLVGECHLFLAPVVVGGGAPRD